MTELATEFTVAALQDLGWLLVEDGNHGEYRPRHDEFGTGDWAFIRAADIDDVGNVLFGQAQRINDDARARIRKGVGARGDVLLSHKGTVGKVAFVGQDAPPFVCSPQTTFWRSLNPEKIDPRFLYFFLRSSTFQQQLDAREGETDMAPYVSLTAQRQLRILLPDIHAQRTIAGILGALEDKIALNYSIDRTLEALVAMLFRSWFVDFDPVHAKSERRPTGLAADVVALFPEGFHDSPLGDIPFGWTVGRLDDALVLKRGFDLPAAGRTTGPYSVISASGTHGSHDRYMAPGPGVVTGRSGVLGKVFFVHEAFWPLNTTLWVEQFRRASPHYAYHLLQSIDLGVLNAGSAVPTLNRNHVHSLPVVLPPEQVVQAFEKIASACARRQRLCDTESRTLTELRDALLPQLLSGAVGLRRAANVVAAVA